MRPAGSRVLVVARHAKTEQGGPDHERALLERGRRDAAVAGRWLEAEVGRPDLVHVSTSRRTRQTWRAMAATAGATGAELWADRRLYLGHPEELLAVLTETPEEAGVVVLVGHSPGVPALVTHLAHPDRSEPGALAELAAGFPTMACAVLEVEGGWAALGEASAVLRGVHVARGR